MSEYPIVLVKNFPYNSSTNLLYELFEKFGHVYQLRVSDGLAPQGTCYVVYSDLSSAKKAARELNGINFHSRYLVAHMYNVEDIPRSELVKLLEMP